MEKAKYLATLSFLIFGSSYADIKAETYATGKFFDNWYVGVDAGAQIMLYSDYDKNSFGNRLGPMIDINLGKWITPNVGVRALGGFSKIRGYMDLETGENVKYKYNLYTFEADIMYNFTNAVYGYKSDRIYNLVPYLGVGAEISAKGDRRGKGVAGYMGLSNQFRLSDAFSINVDLKTAMTSYIVERSKTEGGRSFIMPTGLTVGAVYRFKNRGFRKYTEPDYVPFENKIEQLQSEIAKCDVNIVKLEKELEKAKAVKPEITPVKEVQTIAQAIFFRINSTRLTRSEIQGLELFARSVKNNPGRVYNITGYADTQTGKLKFNESIARKRAKAVADVLINKYGVNPDQLRVDAGNLENPPFTDYIYNRSVILD